MPGGGARAAYQVGVIKALAEVCNRSQSPFPILIGTSAGALNAVGLASQPGSFADAAQWLEDLWMELRYDHVYRSDWPGFLANGLRLLQSMINAGNAIGRPVAILDNLPLKKLLCERIDFQGIGRNIQAGHLSAVCVTAMNYTEGNSISFFQGGPGKAGWSRWRRQGVPTPLQLRHLMASSAIPMIFPPQRIGRNYYGDGALRQLTPISPALHLGANKVLIVAAGGHRRRYHRPYRRVRSPAFGQVLGHLINSAFLDSLETDIEMLERINELLELVPEYHRHGDEESLKTITSLVISPSEDIDTIAEQYVSQLPRTIRSFLWATGNSRKDGGVNIASYLLFVPAFCHALMELGYKDGISQREKIVAFLEAK
jgi:NTE family protein